MLKRLKDTAKKVSNSVEDVTEQYGKVIEVSKDCPLGDDDDKWSIQTHKGTGILNAPQMVRFLSARKTCRHAEL